MKRLLGILLLCVYVSVPALADTNKQVLHLRCGDNTSDFDCLTNPRGGADYQFGVAVKAKALYQLARIWLRVRKHDGSGAKDLMVLKKNVPASQVALMEFNGFSGICRGCQV
ncbi:MAG: hypothetical protein GY927_23315 [bacterium]|nr:hypothetical protein [bacterium]